MTALTPLQLELHLGPDSPAEELDAHTRRIRRDLLDQGVEAEWVPAALPALGAKGDPGPALGLLNLNSTPEQLATMLQVMGLWMRQDPERSAALRGIPAEQFLPLVDLVLSALPRLPSPFARFTYREGGREIAFDYDPATSRPQDLLDQVRATLAAATPGTVTITAQGDITIGGSVVGRDHTTSTLASP